MERVWAIASVGQLQSLQEGIIKNLPSLLIPIASLGVPRLSLHFIIFYKDSQNLLEIIYITLIMNFVTAEKMYKLNSARKKYIEQNSGKFQVLSYLSSHCTVMDSFSFLH